MWSVAKNGHTLEFASNALKNDFEVVSVAIAYFGKPLLYANKRLQNNKKIVLSAVAQYGYALSWTSEELRADREVVLAAVNNNGKSLYYASDNLRADKDVVLAAVKNNGYALEYANDSLRADIDIIMAAVMGDDGEAIVFASKKLRSNKNVVMAAASSAPFGGVLENVGNKLRDDPEVVLAVLLSSSDSILIDVNLKFASDRLRNIIGNDDPIDVLKSIVNKSSLSNAIISTNIQKKRLKVKWNVLGYYLFW